MDITIFDRLSIPLHNGSILQELALGEKGELVGYGIPNKEHDCDAMGCPTVGHVLFIRPKPGATK